MIKEREDKKMEKRILAIIASMAMIGVVFAGCGNKNKKSQEVNKTEEKTETSVDSNLSKSSKDTNPTGFGTGEKKEQSDDVFGSGVDDEKKVENDVDRTVKKVRSKSAPKLNGSNKAKPKAPTTNPKKVVVKEKESAGDSKSAKKDQIKDIEAILKGMQKGITETKAKEPVNNSTQNQGGENKQETANQGAATPAGGEQKKQQEPEKVVKPVPNEGAAPVKEQKLVEPKKN